RPVVEAPGRSPVPPRPAIRTSAAFAPVVNPVSAAGNGEVSALLDRIAGLANEGKSAEARAACERYLKQHEPVAQVFYWLG
ncbi:chemotaxis protein CheR, partial [Pseudomonas syringae pv. tagetis]